jgi:hypothetical protein
VVQTGAVCLASRTGTPLVPVGLAFDGCWRAGSCDAELEALPPGSPIYQMPCEPRTVEYADLAGSQLPNLKAPALEGIELNGQLGVACSALGLSNAWEPSALTYNRGYADNDSLRLGANILCYALTH